MREVRFSTDYKDKWIIHKYILCWFKSNLKQDHETIIRDANLDDVVANIL